MMTNSLDKLYQEARQIVLDAGDNLQKSLRDNRGIISDSVGEHQITLSTKTTFRDLVTSLDIETENRLKEELSAILPGSEFLAEETSQELKQADKLWIIDPIDGTTNFVHRLPFYCVSVALQLGGVLTLGYVYNPAIGEFFEAQLHRGSYSNGERLAVSSTTSLSSSLLATGFAYNFATCKDNNINFFEIFQAKSRGIRRLGSAALDICYVAKGVFDGYWEMYLKPWDAAAGMLITREAGGEVTAMTGEPYSFTEKGILVTNKHLHPEMLALINSMESIGE